MACLYSPTYLS